MNKIKLSLLSVFISLFLIEANASIKKTVSEKSDGIETRYDIKVEGLSQNISPLTKIASEEIRSKFKITHLELKGIEPFYSGVNYKINYPELPVIRFLVSGDVTVKVGGVSTLKIGNSTIIEPSTASVLKKPNKIKKINFDTFAYQSEKFEPSVPYTLEKSGSVNGVPQFLLTLYPLSYKAKSGELTLKNTFTVTTKTARTVKRNQKPVIVFIIGKKFERSESLKDYFQFKETEGFTVIKGVVGKDFNTDTEIRAWLKSKLALGMKHAVIIGDIADVPSHKATHISGYTDHFYRAVDTDNYETDINGPDIGLGRVSVSSDLELSTVLKKFMNYENEVEPKWLKNISFIATDDKYLVAEGSHNYVISNYTSKLGYLGTFPNVKAAVGGDQLYAITHHADTDDLSRAFDEGRSIINYSGHGSESSWAGPEFSQSDVRAIKSDALPFVIGNACVTAAFDNSESFGETWLRSPHAAIAYWGSFDSSYWDEDDILEKRMFDGIFKNGNRELGKITNDALSAVWSQYGGEGKSKYYWETYVLFGDPSTKLRVNLKN